MVWPLSYEKIINKNVHFLYYGEQHGTPKWSYLEPQAIFQRENLTQCYLVCYQGHRPPKGIKNNEIR